MHRCYLQEGRLGPGKQLQSNYVAFHTVQSAESDDLREAETGHRSSAEQGPSGLPTLIQH